MCGIVGYLGKKKAVPILIDNLKRLEYRGYDSAGVAIIEDSSLIVEKSVGKLSKLESIVIPKDFPSTIGIGHTRWATHGKPSDINAHPHTDCKGEIALVHNGIIENYTDLKDELISEGHRFLSETDTEVIVHLVEKYYAGDLLEAVRMAIKRLEGSYAIAVISSKEPEKIVVARKDSPLVLGIGEGEYFVASDIPAVLNYTRNIWILENGEMGELSPSGCKVYDLDGNEKKKETMVVSWDISMAEKGGYPHFMIKEIHEQPNALRETFRGRVGSDGLVKLDLKSVTIDDLRNLRKLYFVACGTAYHAGLVGKYLTERFVRIPVEADIASEFRYRDPIFEKNSLMIVISQSGETADTLAALRMAKENGVKVVAICNVVGSSIARESDDVLYTYAGPEIAVASTKAYTSQLMVIYLFMLLLAQIKGTLPLDKIKEFVEDLRKIPEVASEVLNKLEPAIIDLSRRYYKAHDVFFIGRGLDYALSLEGALKLKEISYIHAEAYAAGELKHGPLSLLEEGVPVVCLATQGYLLDKMVSNIKEVKAREAIAIGFGIEGNEGLKNVCDETFFIPKVNDIYASVITVIPLQLLAYYMAKERGCDIDQPRNLAKSVTVE
ncbi:MAG TPA: glutamine--fructose-6-phosphate transaminase (isomerizing) [bacterium]|nr:glutamine--fructose-6-phosphate transaminase (isomerizing) [bacterium]